ncbi:MAG: hypothetical protein R8L53_09405 [Mariprofundales bacterium]
MNILSPYIKATLLLLVLLCCSITIAMNANFYEHRQLEAESLIYFPNGQANNISLRAYALGFEHFMADLLWMRTLSYFGEHFISDYDYRHLAYMLDIITTLNPEHYEAYRIGAFVLPWMADAVQESSVLTIRAMHAFPQDGLWPYNLALNLYMFENKEQQAAHYLQRAISMENTPKLAIGMLLRLQAKQGNLRIAKQILEQRLKNVQDDKNLHAYIIQKLQAVESEIILQKLDELLVQLRQQGHNVNNITDLHNLGIYWHEPLPDGGKIEMRTSKIYSSKTKQRFILHKSGKIKQLHGIADDK